MMYSIGQLETLIDYLRERNLKMVNTEYPPAELCIRIRNKPKLGWCTLLRGQCQCDTNGCFRLTVREKGKVVGKKPTKGKVSLERIVRDAVLSYNDMFPTCPNDDCEEELRERARFANGYLRMIGTKEEPFHYFKKGKRK